MKYNKKIATERQKLYNYERDMDIHKEHKRGVTLSYLGKKYGISRCRAWQIFHEIENYQDENKE